MDIDWPFAPMLARLARELPVGDYLYEPKWDGFRCLVRREGDDVDLRSRNLRPLSRYFPEIVAPLAGLTDERFVLDGELVICDEDAFDFTKLMARLHPAASRVEKLSRETPASLIVFDVMSVGDRYLGDDAFAERREVLEGMLRDATPPLFPTPVTDDVECAQEWLDRFSGNGIDGVIAKPKAAPYQPGRRVLTKVKVERTVDCVVAGMRTIVDHPMVGSLLLGLYDEDGALRHVGVTSSLSDANRAEFYEMLRPHVRPLAGHPWQEGFGLERSPLGRLGGAAGRWTADAQADWTPVEARLVCEVGFDRWEGDRFRHPAQFKRWRPDRDPQSCGFDQIEIAEPAPVAEILSPA